MLKLQHLRKEYNFNLIIQVPSLEFGNGLFWLQGANGSGKSTLLKIIAGMIPFEGEVEIDSVNLRKHPTEYRRLVNYVESEPLYPSFLNGIDLISFFSTTRKASKENVDKLIQQFQIQSFIKNPIGTYSSGMVKKLSLVLAFIGQPKYILLDEPLVTLDKDTIPILYQLIELQLKQGVNFIFTSHQAFDIVHPSAIELLVSNQQVCYQ